MIYSTKMQIPYRSLYTRSHKLDQHKGNSTENTGLLLASVSFPPTADAFALTCAILNNKVQRESSSPCALQHGVHLPQDERRHSAEPCASWALAQLTFNVQTLKTRSSEKNCHGFGGLGSCSFFFFFFLEAVLSV